MSTRTYYRGPDAVVTDKLFVWRTTPTKGFVVRDLRNVQLIRSKDGLGPYAAPIAGGALVLAAAFWTMLGSPAVYALGALAVAAPAGVAVAELCSSRPAGTGRLVAVGATEPAPRIVRASCFSAFDPSSPSAFRRASAARRGATCD